MGNPFLLLGPDITGIAQRREVKEGSRLQREAVVTWEPPRVPGTHGCLLSYYVMSSLSEASLHLSSHQIPSSVEVDIRIPTCTCTHKETCSEEVKYVAELAQLVMWKRQV